MSVGAARKGASISVAICIALNKSSISQTLYIMDILLAHYEKSKRRFTAVQPPTFVSQLMLRSIDMGWFTTSTTPAPTTSPSTRLPSSSILRSALHTSARTGRRHGLSQQLTQCDVAGSSTSKPPSIAPLQTRRQITKKTSGRRLLETSGFRSRRLRATASCRRGACNDRLLTA